MAGCVVCVLVLVGLAVSASAQATCRTIDNQIGYCIPTSSCKVVTDVFNKIPTPLPRTVISYLRLYKCGHGGRLSRVCCPFQPIYFDEYTEQNYFNLLPEPPDVSNHQNLRLLPTECGYIDAGDRIVGGKVAGLFEFPWMAMLLYSNGRFLTAQCAGTIISSRYILTAAHCIKGNLVFVRVGEYDIRTKTDCQTVYGHKECAPSYQDLTVEKVIPYPKYNKKLLQHDIAIVRISPIDLSRENSRPVCLPLGMHRNVNFTNKYGVVSGWGSVTKFGNISSPILMKVRVPILPLEKCFAISKKLHLYERQICAGGEHGKDSCGGDSGGPLHIMSYYDGDFRFVQQGIVSYGPSLCGTKNLPAVYVKVAYFMDWILDNMEP